jgi:hypothetical protein
MTEYSNRRHQLLDRTNLAPRDQEPHQKLGPAIRHRAFGYTTHRMVAFQRACQTASLARSACRLHSSRSQWRIFRSHIHRAGSTTYLVLGTMTPVIFDSPSGDVKSAKSTSQNTNGSSEKKTLSTPLPNPSLQVTADHNLKQEDAPVYAPGHGEVLLHIKATGVCGWVCNLSMCRSGR